MLVLTPSFTSWNWHQLVLIVGKYDRNEAAFQDSGSTDHILQFIPVYTGYTGLYRLYLQFIPVDLRHRLHHAWFRSFTITWTRSQSENFDHFGVVLSFTWSEHQYHTLEIVRPKITPGHGNPPSFAGLKSLNASGVICPVTNRHASISLRDL